MRFASLACAWGALYLRTTPLTDFLVQANRELAAKEVSCKRDLERGDAEVGTANTAASVASTLVTKALFDLTKVQVELETGDKQLWALSDTQREQAQACSETRVLKTDQHGIAKQDAAVMGRLLATFKDCPGTSFLESKAVLRPLPMRMS